MSKINKINLATPANPTGTLYDIDVAPNNRTDAVPATTGGSNADKLIEADAVREALNSEKYGLNVNILKGSGGTPHAAYANAGAARTDVDASYHALGLKITYLLTDGKWYTDQFIGSDISGWGTPANWQVLEPVSVSQNTETGKTELKIGSEVALTVDKVPELGSKNLVESGGVAAITEKITVEEVAGENDEIIIKDSNENTIVSITDDGIDAKSLKNNGHQVANIEQVEVLDKRTDSIHSEKLNENINEAIELTDDNGTVYGKIEIGSSGNDNKEQFILNYDDDTECLSVGKDGLFVNGEQIKNPTPVIRKLFNYKNIICCGDSVTAGYVSEGTSTQVYINAVVSDRSYPAQLQKMFPGLTFTTKANSGDNVQDWRNHFYGTTDFSEYDLIIFELGLNGYLNYNDLNTEGTNTYNYRKLIQDVRAQNEDAVIALVRSSHFADAWMPTLNFIAQESNCVTIDLMNTQYLNLNDEIYHGYLYQSGEFIFDWAHFTRKGYNAKAYVIAHLLEEKLSDETFYN